METPNNVTRLRKNASPERTLDALHRDACFLLRQYRLLNTAAQSRWHDNDAQSHARDAFSVYLMADRNGRHVARLLGLVWQEPADAIRERDAARNAEAGV
jgi:hypothetical protein